MDRRTPQGNDKADEVYNFIIQYKEAHDGHSPFVRAIMRECDLSSTSHVRYYLDRLAQDGLIRLEDRRIIVVGGKWTLEDKN
jgi:SOS-response transcriptional repressor LexA